MYISFFCIDIVFETKHEMGVEGKVAFKRTRQFFSFVTHVCSLSG